MGTDPTGGSEDAELPGLTEGERIIVNGVADYYWQNDGMPHERGRVIGWLIISDPTEQTTAELVERLGTTREAIDRVADQLVPAHVVLRRDIPGTDEYALHMNSESWPNAVLEVFANIPEFDRILRDAQHTLKDEDAERRQRLDRTQHLFGFIAREVPELLASYSAQEQAAAKAS
ncbi:hypothetical protein [Streptomyces sp. SID3212]|uniref:hypothetical protein n=1 Tax=unclassified Streptomyces TaxID=2593676 RepID=UPI00136DBDF5|nr:hypothetical protein [Streptomyces sp. SID3212]MYV56121.1 hypothetical protein [Streptomyces sp. SID3212]